MDFNFWIRKNQTREPAVLSTLFKARQALEGINLLWVQREENTFSRLLVEFISLQRRFFIAYSLNSLTRNGVGCKAINEFWKCALPRNHIWASYDPSAQKQIENPTLEILIKSKVVLYKDI